MAPAFVENPSDIGPPPFSFSETTSVTFRLKADVNKLEKLTNTLINDRIDTSQHVFEPNRIAPEVHVTFSRFPKVESSDASLGSLGYQEVVFSFPIYDQKPPFEFFQLCAYLFIDGPQPGTEEFLAWSPIATGRELYGLPKVRGEISFDPTSLTGKCLGLLPGAGARLEPQSVIRIELSASDPFGGLRDSINDALHRGRSDDLSRLKDAIAAAETKIAKTAAPGPLEADVSLQGGMERSIQRQQTLLRFFWGDLETVLKSRLGEAEEEFDFLALNAGHEAGLNLGLMGLRQLHDARTGQHDEAVHQQVISARFKFSKFHESPVQDFAVHVDNAEVRDRLGLDALYDPLDGGTDVHFVTDAGAVFAEDGDVIIFP